MKQVTSFTPVTCDYAWSQRQESNPQPTDYKQKPRSEPQNAIRNETLYHLR